MIIGEILARNARMYGAEVALVEREPEKNSRKVMTWKEFDVLANRVANALIEKGVKKGDKVIHLMMNCLEWLPLYFGILRTGAWAVPLNFRFSADDIRYCAEISEGKVLIFGEEFVVGSNTLLILSLGQFVNVVTGSVGGLLSMSGYTRYLFWGGVVSTLNFIILAIFLIPRFGASGAAIAQSVSLTLQMLIYSWGVKRTLGFVPMNIFRKV